MTGTEAWNGSQALTSWSSVPSAVSESIAALTHGVSVLPLPRTALKYSGVPPSNWPTIVAFSTWTLVM